MTSEKPFTEREATTWRTFMEMQEALLGRIEQQLLVDSGLSTADYTVLAVLSNAPDGQLRALNLAQLLQWEKSRLHHQLTRMCKRSLIGRLSGEGRTSYGITRFDQFAGVQRSRYALVKATPRPSTSDDAHFW